jgi:hypothetical protein
VSPLGPLILTVSGLAKPLSLVQLKFPSLSIAGVNVAPFSPEPPEPEPALPFSPFNPLKLNVIWGASAVPV